MFERSLGFVEEAGLDLLHVFPFSPRPGTPAAKMPQVPKPLIRERAARLRAAGDTARARAFERMIGRTASVLVEQPGFGHSEHYLPVRVSAEIAAGEISQVAITGADGEALTT